MAVTESGLVQTFADAEGRRVTPLRKPAPAARNYIYFGGGDIRFGKLTMSDADLQLIDTDPRDPFDFFPARYDVQLVAGYSKNTPARGLKTYMPDYADIPKKPCLLGRAAPPIITPKHRSRARSPHCFGVRGVNHWMT